MPSIIPGLRSLRNLGLYGPEPIARKAGAMRAWTMYARAIQRPR